LALPEGEFQDVLTGASHRGGARPLSELLAQFPVALLIMRN
jgi:maltooligosyltrehalose synthase